MPGENMLYGPFDAPRDERVRELAQKLLKTDGDMDVHSAIARAEAIIPRSKMEEIVPDDPSSLFPEAND